MDSKKAGIYSITSKSVGKRYIGSAVKICARWNRHISDLRLNRHGNQHLQNHFNKYGEDDLLFTVVEIVERGELSLQGFKELLLNREQTYLNNWNECQFNCLPTAGSQLGYKNKGAKYYHYCNKRNQYITSYSVYGSPIVFSYHYTEEEAIKEVELIKSLTEDELLKYKEECLARPTKEKRPPRGAKNYHYVKQTSKYNVTLQIKGKKKFFGSYLTEQEAIDRVNEVKLELGIK